MQATLRMKNFHWLILIYCCPLLCKFYKKLKKNWKIESF